MGLLLFRDRVGDGRNGGMEPGRGRIKAREEKAQGPLQKPGTEDDGKRPGEQIRRVQVNFRQIELAADGMIRDADDFRGDAGFDGQAQSGIGAA